MEIEKSEEIIINKNVMYIMDDYDIKIYKHLGDNIARVGICVINTYPKKPSELLGKEFNIFGF